MRFSESIRPSQLAPSRRRRRLPNMKKACSPWISKPEIQGREQALAVPPRLTARRRTVRRQSRSASRSHPPKRRRATARFVRPVTGAPGKVYWTSAQPQLPLPPKPRVQPCSSEGNRPARRPDPFSRWSPSLAAAETQSAVFVKAVRRLRDVSSQYNEKRHRKRAHPHYFLDDAIMKRDGGDLARKHARSCCPRPSLRGERTRGHRRVVAQRAAAHAATAVRPARSTSPSPRSAATRASYPVIRPATPPSAKACSHR